MTNETATATAEANWEAARVVWEKAGAVRMEAMRAYTAAYCTEDESLRFIENDLADAETNYSVTKDAMTVAHEEWCRIEKAARIEAFLSAENAKINLNF